MKSIMRIFAAALVLLMSLTASAQMKTEANTPEVKKQVELTADVVVCGGGLAGVCAAVSAARHGATVVLVQDRPVLGGNASSEMRMGIVGTKIDDTQETGILEEMQLRNFYYNPLQRYTMWDDAIYTTVVSEPNITLLLNTSVNDVVMNGERIAAVKAWNINAYTEYKINGTIFADCTGDGILRLSGAKYRHGRENPAEFNENCQAEGNDAKTMGNSILIQLRKTDVDVPFKAPEWAYHFTDADFDYSVPESTIPGMKFNYKRIYHPHDNNFWWCEFGGNFDTIADANDIQYELKRIVYGIWEYMKNHP
ncbi:MAG: FAD-dependent oxidoreductase, partial [Alistipes sp.]|nr:FAD-dependent oxidoreductase [Alistipes sp.]